jgi:threonine/homoserine/homoserine lactone efflux protein
MSEAAMTLARGALVGFAIAAPVGPVGLLCIRRTFAHGPSTGLATGLGAAAADAMYGLVAALGVGAVASLLLEHASTLRIAGGMLMALLGMASLRRARQPAGTAPAAVAPTPSGLLGAFGTTFALTASSPMTILSFAGLLAALAPPEGSLAGSLAGGLLLVAGVFTGSIAWWLILVGGVSASRKAIAPNAIRWIEAVSGVALLAFAAWSLATGLSGGAAA